MNATSGDQIRRHGQGRIPGRRERGPNRQSHKSGPDQEPVRSVPFDTGWIVNRPRRSHRRSRHANQRPVTGVSPGRHRAETLAGNYEYMNIVVGDKAFVDIASFVTNSSKDQTI